MSMFHVLSEDSDFVPPIDVDESDSSSLERLRKRNMVSINYGTMGDTTQDTSIPPLPL